MCDRELFDDEFMNDMLLNPEAYGMSDGIKNEEDDLEDDDDDLQDDDEDDM